MTSNTSGGQAASGLQDDAAASADAAIRSAREKAHDALSGLSGTMQSVKDQATATMERLRPQLDTVTNYAKDEPTKALLIAAAAGAGIMGLIALMARSSSGSDMPSPKSLRKAAYDSLDELRKATASATDDWRKAASKAGDDATSRASGAMDTAKGAAKAAYEGLADTMSQWKDQAAPIVDRIRPQMDAVTSYAKDDPAKALLIAAAAGAALMGLMNSLGRSDR